jgi:hypothetical protein
MGNLWINMWQTTLCTPCIAFMLVSHTCIITIGHAEQGLEEAPDQDQSRPIATSKTKANPGASKHNP